MLPWARRNRKMQAYPRTGMFQDVWLMAAKRTRAERLSVEELQDFSLEIGLVEKMENRKIKTSHHRRKHFLIFGLVRLRKCP